MKSDVKKVINRIKTLKNYSIPVFSYNDTIGSLRPITYFDIGNDLVIENLMTWRNQNLKAYLSREEATFEGTRRWLAKYILYNKSKVLFLVFSDRNKPIGHMGMADGLHIADYVELDNIVRGIKSEEKGLMTLALYDLISWIFQSFDCHKVYLRVFSDNERAISMYQNLKFFENKKFALEKTITKQNVVNYRILDKKQVKEKYFSYQELERNDHFENYKNIKDKVNPYEN